MKRSYIFVGIFLLAIFGVGNVKADDFSRPAPEGQIVEMMKAFRHSCIEEQRLADKFESVHFLELGTKPPEQKLEKAKRAVLVSMAAGCKILRDFLFYSRKVDTKDKTALVQHYRMAQVQLETAVQLTDFEAYKDLNYVNDFDSYRALRSVLKSISAGLKQYQAVKESYFADYPGEINKIFSLMKQAGANLDEVIKELPGSVSADAKAILHGSSKTIQKLLEFTKTSKVTEFSTLHDEVVYFRFRHEVAFCLEKMKENLEKNTGSVPLIKAKMSAAYGALLVEKNSVADGKELEVGFIACMKHLKSLVAAVSDASLAYKYFLVDIKDLP